MKNQIIIGVAVTVVAAIVLDVFLNPRGKMVNNTGGFLVFPQRGKVM